MFKKPLVLGVLVLSLSSFAHAAQYKLDVGHTEVGFKIKHLVISTVRGRFDQFEGSFDFDDKKKELKNIDIKIKAKSINTNEADRDNHLRNQDFFHVEKYPEITFKAKSVKFRGKKPFAVEGDLSLHGVTKKVKLMLTYKGMVTDPWGNTRVAFSGKTKIKRADYGLKWNKKLDKGAGFVIGNNVKIELEVEAMKQ